MRYSYQHSCPKCASFCIHGTRCPPGKKETRRRWLPRTRRQSQCEQPVLTLKMNGLFAEQTCSSRYFTVGGEMSFFWDSFGPKELMYAGFRCEDRRSVDLKIRKVPLIRALNNFVY
ncbi:hypothetical protein NPIL_375721 [Nephila pilipes]|uniref:Uncharacterized protein n=1 Tax=Nephila pilipes TaxID=299642 RepID=A0A8X6MVL2_NEPPI|nr:hypothetical protein NPIL_375721 [Nephila pilipes]